MTTDVIIRIDDVTGKDLSVLVSWFQSKHPKIPVAAFATKTDRWRRRHWQLARQTVEWYGWEIGGHTRNHTRLSVLDTEAMFEVIRANVGDIESGLANVGLDYDVNSFAYPYGDYDSRTIEALEELDICVGVTYPDGYPYTSVDSLPSEEDHLKFGVTHHGKHELDVWNHRFDRVRDRDGLYVLCLHPQRWEMESLIATMRTYVRERMGYDRWIQLLSRQVRANFRPNHQKSPSRLLDQHLRHIGDYDVKFTTYRELL